MKVQNVFHIAVFIFLIVFSISTLIVSASSSSSSSASSSSVSSENHPGLIERVTRLNDVLAKKGDVIKLDGEMYTKLLRTAPRNYSVVLMLTSLNPRQNCKPCVHVAQEFAVAANSWRRSNKYVPSSLYFAIAEFDSSPEIFEKLKLQTIPVIMHFPPVGSPKPDDTYKMQTLGLEAESIAKFVTERTSNAFLIYRPPDYSKYILIIATLLVASLAIYKFLPDIFKLYRNPTVWAIVSVLFCCNFASGAMWNQIRQPAYSYNHPQSGEPVLFHPSSQSQFGIESHIVLVLYAVASSAIILLNMSAPYYSSAIKRRSAVYMYLGIFAFILSLIFAVFRSKQRGYPFRLFL